MADEAAPPTSTARVDTELLEKARVICAHRKTPGGKPLKLTDLLDSILRRPIEELYEEVMDQVANERRKRKRT
jgi:hypothetical protein